MNRISKLYYFLTLWVVCISGNPVVTIFGKETIYVGTLLVLLWVWFYRSIKLNNLDLLTLGGFALLSLAHILSWGSLAIAAELGFLIKLAIALLTVKVIPDFTTRYVRAMYWLSIISFMFWIPLYLGVDMRGMFASMRISLPLDSLHFHIGLYNLREEYDLGGSVGVRNMGMFWEPGAFAGYLVLAIFFIVRDTKSNFLSSKYGIVIFVALLSTQSTTGYVALIALTIFYVYSSGIAKDVLAKFVIFPIFIFAFASLVLVLFSQTSFLGEKINAQIESASMLEDASRINRFGNLLYDLEWIADRPVLGWSANPETRLAFDPEALELASAQGNGLTGFAVKNGVLGVLMFFGFFAYATKRSTSSIVMAFMGVIVVAMLLSGEQFLGFPVFLTLMFLNKVDKTEVPKVSRKGKLELRSKRRIA